MDHAREGPRAKIIRAVDFDELFPFSGPSHTALTALKEARGSASGHTYHSSESALRSSSAARVLARRPRGDLGGGDRVGRRLRRGARRRGAVVVFDGQRAEESSSDVRLKRAIIVDDFFFPIGPSKYRLLVGR